MEILLLAYEGEWFEGWITFDDLPEDNNRKSETPTITRAEKVGWED